MSAMSSAMASPSISDASHLSGSTKKMAHLKSNIQVNLENHYNSKIYTSSSPVKGTVTITTKRDVRFDALQIVLIGNTKTRVDGVNSPHEITHTFLKMVMPIPESTYPVPRTLETGRTYTVPFNFVIPHQLTINACHHTALSGLVQDQHCLLPPSMGNSSWEKDDMAPQMAHVEYCVKARVIREDGVDGKRTRIMEAVTPLRVLPASVEEPPLVITEKDTLYAMTKTKTVRKNLLSSKLGHLIASATQPGPAVLGSDARSIVSRPATEIQLQFEPASIDVAPPKILSVSGKVKAHTFFSGGTISTFPNLGEWNQQFVPDKRGAYSTSAALAPMPTPEARWTQHLTDAARRDSGYSSENSPDNAESGRSGRKRASKSTSGGASPIFHTASIQVPITLPVDNKTFVPTFHSCIASRVYTVQLSVVVAAGSGSTTINLTVPLQVAIESDLQPQYDAGLPSFEAAVEAAEGAEADAHLQPRVLAVPEQHFRDTSILPAYPMVAVR